MSRTQKQFFAVYFSFFLFLLLMLLPTYLVAMDALTQNALEIHEGILREGLSQLDQELGTILLVAEALHDNADIRALSLLNPQNGPAPTPAEAYTLRRSLAYYRNIAQIVDLPSDMGLAFKNGVILASGLIHRTPEAFYGPYLSDPDSPSFDAWRDKLAQARRPYTLTAMRISTAAGARESVVFSVSLPLYSQWQTFFYAVLDQHTLLEKLALWETLENGGLTLTDATGKVLIDYEVPALGSYVSVRAQSARYGLTAELKLEKALFAGKMENYRRLLMIAMGLYALLGVGLSIAYARRNARPVARMLHAASEVCGSGTLDKDAFKNGYAYMDAFIAHVDATLHANLLAMANQQTLLRENLLERLLRGDIHNARTFDTARRYFPDYPSPCRPVALNLLVDGERNAEDDSSLRVALAALVREAVAPGSLLHFTGNLLVVLQPDAPPEALRAVYASIRQRAFERMALEMQVGIGMPLSRMEELHRAFRQLQLELRMRERALFVLEPRPGNPAAFLRMHNPEHFYAALSRMRCEEAEAYLKEDLEALRAHGVRSETELQQGFYSYRAVLERLVDENGATSVALPEYRQSPSLSETFEGILACARQLTVTLQAQRQANLDQFAQTVLEAVDESLDDPALGIQMITERFSISGNTLQRIMRDTAGKSFFEYVNARRMARAKQLLLHTRLPIAEVSVRCGYASVNSFYKAFRRCFHIPPNTLRESGADA